MGMALLGIAMPGPPVTALGFDAEGTAGLGATAVLFHAHVVHGEGEPRLVARQPKAAGRRGCSATR